MDAKPPKTLPGRAELARELLNTRQLVALLLRRSGGEAVVSPVEMEELPRQWTITQRQEIDGSLRFTLTDGPGRADGRGAEGEG